jgi:hypothetical protein
MKQPYTNQPKGALEKRFTSYIGKNCLNGNMKFNQMNLGIHFAEGLGRVLQMDADTRLIKHLDLSCNVLGDRGAAMVAE